jgi:hypothetical protein
MVTLITGEEIKENCGLSPNFPAIDLKSCKGVENFFFSKHLTLDLYKKLLSYVVDYSGEAEWSNTTTYSIGGIAKRGNKVYKALEANIDFRPPNSKWEIAPKLWSEEDTSEANCINTIWCDGFLAETLSWAVLVARLPFINNKIETDGIGTTVNDKFVKADIKEFQITQGAAQKMYEMSLDNLKTWLDANKCFVSVPEIDACCDPCAEKSKKPYDWYLIA